jgi:mRNA interferase HigB
MRVISERRLREFWQKYRDAESALRAWHKVASNTNWDTFADLRQSYPSADMVGRCVIFNICGNKYRLITTIRFDLGRVYIRGVLTHREYDLERWKEECLCRE